MKEYILALFFRSSSTLIPTRRVVYNTVQLSTIISFFYFLSSVGLDLHWPSLPFMILDLEVTRTQLQSVFSIPFFVSAIFRITLGPFVRFYGIRNALLTAQAIAVLGCILSASSQTLWTLILGRFLHGITGALMGLSSSIVIGDFFTDRKRARMFGLVETFLSSAVLLAPLTGAFFCEFANWRFAYLVMGALYFIGFIFLFFKFHLEEKNIPQVRLTEVMQAYYALMRNPFFVLACCTPAVCLGIGQVFTANSAFLYMQQNYLTPPQYAFYQTLPTVVNILLGFFYRRQVMLWGVFTILLWSVYGLIVFIGLCFLLFQGWLPQSPNVFLAMMIFYNTLSPIIVVGIATYAFDVAETNVLGAPALIVGARPLIVSFCILLASSSYVEGAKAVFGMMGVLALITIIATKIILMRYKISPVD